MDFIVTHGKLKERDARRIFRQVVEAIDYWFPWDSTSSTPLLLGVDGISLFFIILTTLLIFLESILKHFSGHINSKLP